MSNQKIIINDLLSFFISKLDIISKNILINCLNSYYSRSDILDAKYLLIKSLPSEILPTFGLESDEQISVLSSIYDCLKISKEHLPTFVCRNLNNIPKIENKNLEQDSTIKDFKINGNCFENFDGFEHQHWNEEICRKEQQEMKLKISEMLVMLTDIKDGLKKYKTPTVKSTKRQEANIDEHHSKLNNISKYNKSVCDKPVIALKCFNDHSSKCFLELKTECKDLDKTASISPYEINKPVAVVISRHVEETVISINENDLSPLECDSDNEEIADQENYITHVFDEIDTSPLINTDNVNENEISSQNTKRDLRSCAPDKCPICKIILTSKLDYDIHAKTHYSKGTYDCALCNQTFITRDGLIDHFLLCLKEDHLNMKERSCSVCGSFYADQQSLMKHKSLHSECRLISCTLCSIRFFTKKGLELHMRNQHNPMNKYECPLCSLSFFFKSYLFAHITIHTGAKPFSCNVCEQKTDTKKAMKFHLHSHETGTIKKFKCKECKYLFGTSYGLLKHRLSEHQEAIQCTFCEKTFQNPSSYKKHFDLHKSEINFKCKLCTYSTMFKRYLDKHMLSHPASSLFSCTKCNIPLSSKHTIGIHLKNYCIKNKNLSKNSSDVNSLQNNDYKCSLCLYITSCKQNMEKHMITHTPDSSFFCPKCCIPLSSKHNVGHHLRSYCTKNDEAIS